MMKSSKNLLAKVWRRKLNEAKLLDHENRNEDAMTHYQYIYAKTISDEFQRIASDAAAGIVGLHIKGNDFEKAIEEVRADVSEIKSQFVTPLLLRQLASAFVLSKNIHAAAFVCLYAVTSKFRMHNYFQALLLHISRHYPAQLKELNDQILDTGNGFMKLEVEKIVEVATEIKPQSPAAPINEQQIKEDMKSFLFWRAICPEEKELEVQPEALVNAKTLLSTQLQNGIRSLRANNYPEAASSFREALGHAETAQEKVVVQYCLSMALLDSKRLENVKEGQSILRELFQSNMVEWEVEFPAIIYGMARYELAVNEPDHKFLSYSLKVSCSSLHLLTIV